MGSFPSLKEGEVALMHTDVKTGDVLDSKYMPFVSSEQILYVVFDSLELALTYIQKEVRPLRDVEVLVYNANKDVVHYYNPIEPSRN